jgi:hypothetical protein
MNCKSCNYLVKNEWKVCPNCGFTLPKVNTTINDRLPHKFSHIYLYYDSEQERIDTYKRRCKLLLQFQLIDENNNPTLSEGNLKVAMKYNQSDVNIVQGLRWSSIINEGKQNFSLEIQRNNFLIDKERTIWFSYLCPEPLVFSRFFYTAVDLDMIFIPKDGEPVLKIKERISVSGELKEW